MRRFDAHQLRDFLNYDTNTKRFLTFSERLVIHQAIAIAIGGFTHKRFPPKLQMKLVDCMHRMNKSGWQAVNIFYKVEDEQLIEITREQ